MRKCFIGNLDGRREGLVVARSARQAAEIVGTSVKDFADYWHPSPDWPMQTIYPYELYTRPFDSKGPWVKGRCEAKAKEGGGK